MRSRYRRISIIAGLAALAVLTWSQGSELLRHLESDAPSQSFGTPAAGHLVNGKRLPIAGRNYRAYSRLGALLGRTCVDSRVRDVLLDAFAQLETAQPETLYEYGETGWPRGGRFYPHKSHESGRSVDLLLPARRAERSEPLACWPWNRFCYGLHFDAQGRMGPLALDVAATNAELRALADAAPRHGLRIKVVILDFALRALLFAGPGGAGLAERIAFNTKLPWIKHDQHLHVDFEPL